MFLMTEKGKNQIHVTCQHARQCSQFDSLSLSRKSSSFTAVQPVIAFRDVLHTTEYHYREINKTIEQWDKSTGKHLWGSRNQIVRPEKARLGDNGGVALTRQGKGLLMCLLFVCKSRFSLETFQEELVAGIVTVPRCRHHYCYGLWVTLSPKSYRMLGFQIRKRRNRSLHHGQREE